ncbi:MAG: ExbD/TolR family protein [Parasphingopyxis sp.]|nr:biopolymer transporter ExbD [Sphingomonadales bacterium]
MSDEQEVTMAFIQSQPAPMGSINMTPLIDVLLVLLVMFLLALPVMTHKVSIDLPAGPPVEGPPPPAHRLSITQSGAILWDGEAVPDGELRPRLRALAADPGNPLLEIAADGAARYERVDQLLAEVNRSGVTRIGFVGHRAFSESF